MADHTALQDEAMIRTIRLLLVDDSSPVRHALRFVVDYFSDLQIVGEAVNGEEAVRLVCELQPEVVLMDISMPRLNGIEATRQIRREHPQVAVIGLTVYEDDSVCLAMREAGAALCLSKGSPADELYAAIQSVLPGGEGTSGEGTET